MSDTMTQDPWDLLQNQRTTQEGVKSVEEADLVPKGKYEGIIHDDVSVNVDDRETFQSGDPNPMYNQARARLHAELFDPLGGSSKHYFFDASGAEIKGRNGQLLEACKHGTMLASATSTVGESFAQTVKAAIGPRFTFDIGVTPAKGQWKARNRLNGIAPASTSNGY